MGCDIHFHSEVKINGKWEHYNTPSIDREYSLFAKMANVRNYNCTDPISEPKGLPEDISIVTKLHADYWEGDAHSHSWLNREEICELQRWLESHMGSDKWQLERNYWGYLFGNGWNDELPEGIEDIRFVFWFDN